MYLGLGGAAGAGNSRIEGPYNYGIATGHTRLPSMPCGSFLNEVLRVRRSDIEYCTRRMFASAGIPLLATINLQVVSMLDSDISFGPVGHGGRE